MAEAKKDAKNLLKGACATGNYFSKCFTQVHTKDPHLCKSDVVAYRDYILKHGPKVDVSDSTKNNKMAAQIRLDGNRLLNGGDLAKALDKYSESICWATNGSKNLAMGYANRSAVCYSIGEYEFALVNIAVAKEYNYPIQLMPELLEREVNCKKMIMNGRSSIRPLMNTFMFNVERNPKLPFLAEGIIMKELPDYGRSMVADRDFKAGAVILDERLFVCSVNPNRKYSVCHYCSSALNGRLIPCLGCISVMYCSKECRKAGMKIHRFECGISEKLDHISYGASRIGLRLFFHGLNLFDDDVDRMMEFCRAHGRTGADPFTLDYSNYDPLEEFKVFQQTKVPDIDMKTDSIRFHAALYYSILIEHPPVQAVLTSESQQDFMLRCIYEYMRTTMFLASYQVNMETFHLYSIAAVCNHSCIPNTYAVSYNGRLKFVVLRPIQKGEQILTSYNIMYSAGDLGYYVPHVKTFQCICMVCDPKKKRARLANSRKQLPCRPEYLNIPTPFTAFGPSEIECRLTEMEVFMKRYGHLHPHKDFDQFIRMYRERLTTALLVDCCNRRRVQITENWIVPLQSENMYGSIRTERSCSCFEH